MLPIPSSTELASLARNHPLFPSALSERAIPSTREMAIAGLEIARQVWGPDLGPDDFISRGLDAESQLYFEMEGELEKRRLHSIMGGGQIDFEAVLAWAMRARSWAS